jgi:tRNA threonylcarbamoyladenosine biosynthesis protein TsaE
MIFQAAITAGVIEISCQNEAEMLALGARIGSVLKMGDVVALSGELGAGKTTLIRGLIQSLLPHEEVPSPTYTLVQTYDLPDYELWHCDLYRLKHPDEAFELGLLEAFEDAVCMLEWPDKIGTHLPNNSLTIEVKFAEVGRLVIFGENWSEKGLS